MPNPETPRAIRASIHQSALTRMSRLFDNRLETIVLELVQNARRSGATQIRIGICPPPAASDARSSAVPIEIGIEDDGTGIADPAVVLAFGASGWDAATVRVEDAAGMGIACLASTGCTIRSATASGNGWKTTLEPAHFTGERTAEIDAAPKTERGTRIAFVRTVDTTALGAHATRIRHIRNACANIARDLRETLRHYPLPITVCVQHDPRAEPTVTAMTPEDFLAAAQHRATVNGIRFGVFRKRHGAHPHADQIVPLRSLRLGSVTATLRP